MDKQQLVSFINSQISIGKITKQDLLNIAQEGVGTSPTVFPSQPEALTQDSTDHKNIGSAFLVIGGVIVIAGAVILVSQYWITIGFIGRVLVTLGLSLLTYILGITLTKPDQRVVSQVMYAISASLAPIGVMAVLNEAKIDYSWDIQLLVSVLLVVLYSVARFINKRSILFVLIIIFSTSAYYAAIFKVLDLGSRSFDIMQWAGIVLGACYILIAYSFRFDPENADLAVSKEERSIQGLLNGVGALSILGFGITIGGFFDFFYILVLFAGFYASIYLKSRAMLLFSSLFLMAHMIKLTSKFFVNSLGWPISLIVIGFLIIGVGYGSYQVKKKYQI